MAFMAALEADLRALSAEARRRYPAVKDGAEHAILKLRSLSSPSEISSNEDVLRIFLLACEVRAIKLSVIGLSCLQKLISHDAVNPSALTEILSTLKDHAEMMDESVQLRTLQTILIIFQSRLHPANEDNMVQALGICLRLLDNNRSPHSVRNTAAATFRQAVALIFDHVVSAESLPALKSGSGGYISRTGSIAADFSQNISKPGFLEKELQNGRPSEMRETLSTPGKLGLRLLEDLTASAAGGYATWLRVASIPRTFALELLEFILSKYESVFKTLFPYEQVLRHQICSILMTSLRTNAELEGETDEPYFRRLVLRSVAHIIRLYGSSLITECEVFLSMLLKVTFLDLPLWHRILVLEIFRGFCMDARTLQILFQNFDMHPKNTNVVEGIVKALARIVSSVQFHETSEESLAAVAAMFSSKAKGVEWSLENDASTAAVLVASEAHAITLAIEGLLGVVFTVATLTDEAVDIGELESPRYEYHHSPEYSGKTALLCISMVDSLWLTILDALSLILSRSQGEAIVLEILKGYQAFTQACGVLHAIQPLNSFLASLCKFTINFPNDAEKKGVLQSPGSKRSETLVDQKDSVVLTQKNVQALRTLFNIAHRLHNVLGPSWVLVLETLAALDRAIHSPHATTQEVSITAPKLARESSGHYTDFNVLSSLNSQLFESSALMHVSAVKSLLSALHQLSRQYMAETSGTFGAASSQKAGSISFTVERMICILINNLHRVEPLWDQIVGHFLELAEHSNQNLRNMGLNALDQSICAVLSSKQFEADPSRSGDASQEGESRPIELHSLECVVLSPLRVLYFSTQSVDSRAGSLKILLHVLERCGERLYYSWPSILEMLRSVADASEKDLVTLGFQNLRVILNDGLSSIPEDSLHVCIDVTAAYSAQKTELNISLTSIGLLWTVTDFIAKDLHHEAGEESEIGPKDGFGTSKQIGTVKEKDQTVNLSNKSVGEPTNENVANHDKLLFLVFSLLQKLGDDERPEVRNAAVRTLFQILGSYGHKLSKSMWEACLWNYVFPMLDSAQHKAATSSKDESQGKEIGTRGGKAVHMLIHHSRNSAQKQWEETLVLVLGGIARIFRFYFPFLERLSNFWSGWESLRDFVKNSIFSGTKEVALAAVNCLQTPVLSHCVKGKLPVRYLNSVIDIYELVFQKSLGCGDSTATKVKQEILHGLGELYQQARGMFDDKMYSQLLTIIDLSMKQAMASSESFELEFGHVPPVVRTVLEIVPLLGPPDHLASMWLVLLREFMQYLPRPDSALLSKDAEAEQTSSNDQVPAAREVETLSESSGSEKGTKASIPSYLFAEKVVPVVVDLLLQAPVVEKYILCPEIIQSLGRCMLTRRDNPDGSLWRSAAEGFNRLVLEEVGKFDLNSGAGSKITRAARIRVWKEVADIYEIFLVGYCGRALSSNSLPATAHKADENLEITMLDVLGDTILKSPADAPREILERLVSTLDRCASRTCFLPVETVELMPAHCSRFSLTCLQKLFSLSFTDETSSWSLMRSEVSKISITMLMSRCDYILRRFLIDENSLGERPLPAARLEEIIYVLQELANLKIHPDTASVLPLHPFLKSSLREDSQELRLHLLVLFSSFSELIVSRVDRVRELVQVLLRLIAAELALDKVKLSG